MIDLWIEAAKMIPWRVLVVQVCLMSLLLQARGIIEADVFRLMPPEMKAGGNTQC